MPSKYHCYYLVTPSIPRTLLDEIKEKGIKIEVRLVPNPNLNTGVPIKVFDGKVITVRYKDEIIGTFKTDKEANKFLDEINKNPKELILLSRNWKIKINDITHDILDQSGNIIFRGLPDDILKYLKFLDLPLESRKLMILDLNKNLIKNTNRYNKKNALLKEIDIPESKNGNSPDFSSKLDFLYRNDQKFGEIKIKIRTYPYNG